MIKIFFSEKLITEKPQRDVEAFAVSGAFTSHELLKKILFEFMNLPENPQILRTERGKPYLPDYPQVQFSVTHTRHFWACATADFPVGLDMELRCRHVKNPQSIADRYFSPDEALSIASAMDGASRLKFLEIWTKKEAWLKLHGKGIADGLDKFSVLKNDADVKFIQYNEKGLIISLCTKLADCGQNPECEFIYMR